jgi:hypothetical protein
LDGYQPEWFNLAQEIGVDAVALEVLVDVIHEGKWLASTAPLLYLRKNVERLSQEWEDPFTEDGRLHHAQIFSPVPTREDRKWLKCLSSFREMDAIVTPADIDAARESLKIVQDEEERGVLCARALGLTRAEYLSGVSDSERRTRAAAWKRLYRHGVPTELRKALRGASGRNAIIRPGFEDRAWRDSEDYRWDGLFNKSTPVRRHEY